MRSYYSILELPDFSTTSAIVASYRRLAMKWHPDRNTSPDASEIFVKIQAAYEILKNDEQKKYYDAWLREQQNDRGAQSTSNTEPFYDTKMAQQAREYAYKYADMSFEEFSEKLKIKAKKAAFTVLHWVGIGFILIVASIGGMIGKQIGSTAFKGNSEKSVQQELKVELDKLVLDMNKDLPRLLDAETRLDSVSMSGKVMVSKHTFPNYASNEVDPEMLQSQVKNNLRNQLCISAKDLMSIGYSYRYEYFGKFGDWAASFTFGSSDCRQ